MSSSESAVRFEQLALAAPVLQAIQAVGYEAPSPIQAAAIPPLLAGRDLLGMAQTGTGKTAAFALPLLSRIELKRRVPQVLVLTPTRELAIQVAEAFQAYARFMPGFHVLPVYGGQSMSIQLRHLSRGAHVVVGTPGRVMDHLRRKTLNLDGISSLVLDEADEMLNMGFVEDVEWILGHAPESRQIALFSATMPAGVRKVAKRHLADPAEIKIESRTSTVETVTQRYWEVSGLHKLDALTRLLEVEEVDATIIFVRTKTATVELAERLEARGYASAALNGDMNQVQRERTVDQLKRKALDIVVATDVAARGLDIQRISHVINYDIPNDTEAYVHRIGRTGRAGRRGDAILFVAPRERRMLHAIERATGQRIERMQMPTSEAISDRRIAQFKQRILDTLESEELEFYRALIEQLQQESDLEAREIAAALAFLGQGERPLKPAEKPKRAERKTEGAAPEGKKHARRPRDEQPDEDKVRYRLDVGRNDGVKVGNIVGAIANEAGLDSCHIGRVTLHDEYSTVDLPEGMPQEIFKHLQKVRVGGRPLKICPIDELGKAKGGKKAGKKPAKGKKAVKGKKLSKRKSG